MITLENRSGLTGKVYTMELPLTQREFERGCEAMDRGVLIQYAFPTLNADQREFILTGITPEEWDAHFGPTEDEEA